MHRGKSQNPTRQNMPNNQLDVLGRHDPFQSMNQIMRGFGGFGAMSAFKDDFFKDDFMMRPFGDPLQRMMGFSDLHQKAQRNGKEGSYFCQSFVSSSTLGSDGKVNKHTYFQNSAGEHKNGKTISQKHQAYKNSDGLNRIAEERMLNDKGHKIIKQKRGNNIEQTNHYYNIDEEEAPNFHQNWRSTDQELKFLDNYSNYMRSIDNEKSHQSKQLQLGHQPHYQQSRNPPKVQAREKVQQRNDIYSTKGSQKSQMNSSSRGSRKA